MSNERKLAEFHLWTLAVLNLLGATPGHQAQYLQETRVGADELLLQLDDVLHVARARLSDGSLTRKDYLSLLEVAEAADSLDSSPGSVYTDAALETSSEWRNLRTAANSAKASLEKTWDLNLEDQNVFDLQHHGC
ncbi:hypothetical protein [Streptomyces caatingaensis]|uniref:hypothetical protein n=1 Tax=Streptomyces caatingaensis TaxID=1678637 RepID=UPI000A450FD8|nr:hypothetical protein [Streptomyces caatingaensis]